MSGYLPHTVVAESSLTIQQMAHAFMTVEYQQIVNGGARSDLCLERATYWKGQILMVTEKFPPLPE